MKKWVRKSNVGFSSFFFLMITRLRKKKTNVDRYEKQLFGALGAKLNILQTYVEKLKILSRLFFLGNQNIEKAKLVIAKYFFSVGSFQNKKNIMVTNPTK